MDQIEEQGVSIHLTPLEARQAEVAQYEANIALYESILATLPKEFPSHLLQYKDAENQHQIAAQIDDPEDLELLAKMWYANECTKSIRAEIVEMTKAKAILAVLEA
jgi:hypothetical protein